MNIKKKLKGIVLAGGNGSRLYPITQTACKQLLPVYNKPLINYPISTLINFGITEILIISTPQDLPQFEKMFSNGSQLGLKISYEIQIRPEGIAQAFLLAENFIENDNVMLILGDNIFYGDLDYKSIVDSYKDGALIFGYQAPNPKRYGVIEFDENGEVAQIEEKPEKPKSDYVVTGLYVYDSQVVEIAKALKKSARGEYEITDINNTYIAKKKLKWIKLQNNIKWLDTGTFESLLEAGKFIATVEKEQGNKFACLEELTARKKIIDKIQLRALIEKMPQSDYRIYLEQFADKFYEKK